MYVFRAVVAILKLLGPGPYTPKKKWWGPGPVLPYFRQKVVGRPGLGPTAPYPDSSPG